MVVLLGQHVDLVVRLVTRLLAVKSGHVKLTMPGLDLNHSVSKSRVTSVSPQRTDICPVRRAICTIQSVLLVAKAVSPSKAMSKLRSVLEIRDTLIG